MKKRIITALISVFFCISLFCAPSFAASDAKSYVLDPQDYFSEKNEQTILDRAAGFAEKTGMNIVIFITDDIGTDKSDRHVVDLADDTYEQYCGINTDGILLLINCDTKCDHISTSGKGINYYSDDRLDSIFASIDGDLRDGNYAQAAYDFVVYAESWYDRGMDNHQTEIFGKEVEPSAFVFGIGRLAIFAFIIGSVIFAYYSKQFKLEKPNTRNYVLNNSLAFDTKTDVFVENVTTRVYSPRSSSSSGHHSSSHHSSTHHSHSGGRHGGRSHHR